ncbi:MAG: outer membrane protein assembly factor BamB [Pseudomonadota bacterium]
MRLTKLPILLIVFAMLGACGEKAKDTDFFGAEEKPRKPKVSNQTSLDSNWRIGVGEGTGAGGIVISPALLGANIYAAAVNGRIVKADAQTGRVVWDTRLKKKTITGGVGVGGGLVLVGTSQGVVHALNQSDGAEAWNTKLDSEILASPVIEDDVVIARSGDGKVYGLAAYDGEILWTISRQLPRLTLRGDSEPLVLNGAAIAGFADGTLAAVEAKTGRALWDFPISFPRGTNEIDRLADIDTKPLLVGDFIYVSSYQEIMHALNIKQQGIAWSTSVSSYHPIAFDSAYLYLSDRHGVVHKIDRTDGAKVWSQDALRLFTTSAPIAVGPYVLISDGDGSIYTMRKRDGQLVGKHGLGAKTIVGEPIVDSDTIYFIDSDGTLRSLNVLSQG